MGSPGHEHWMKILLPYHLLPTTAPPIFKLGDSLGVHVQLL